MKKRLTEFRAGLFPVERNHLLTLSAFSLAYIIWTTLVVGFRQDHFVFLLFIACMLFIHRWTRALAYSFVFFTLFWIIYDSMRILPNYMVNPVHVMEPYLLEKSLFGIRTDSGILTPNEFFEKYSSGLLDFISGFFYLTWVPVPMALGIYLFARDKKMLLSFSGAYLFTNLVGFLIYYIYPAAPPWYVAKYGNQQLFDIPGDVARLIYFDQMAGYPIFQSMYVRNSNVFAAIPSLHAAYPVVTWFYARKEKLKWPTILIFIDILGIWFAAVYSGHHYVIDVLLGFLCAVTGIAIYEKWLMQTRFSAWLDRYVSFIHRSQKRMSRQA